MVLTLNIFKHSMQNLRLQAFEFRRCVFISLTVSEIFIIKMCPRLLEHPVLSRINKASQWLVYKEGRGRRCSLPFESRPSAKQSLVFDNVVLTSGTVSIST